LAYYSHLRNFQEKGNLMDTLFEYKVLFSWDI